RERLEREQAQPAPAPAEAGQPEAGATSLRADLVLRAGWAAAVLSQLGMMATGLAGAQVLAPLVLLFGGGYAVHLYRRRSGSALNVLQGLRLGWFAGLFSFVLVLVFFTLSVAVISSNRDALKAAAESAPAGGMAREAVEQLQRTMEKPADMVGQLAVSFVFLTVCSAAGGAIAARLLARGTSPRA
ncbi:MAG: hypothetical protein HXY18_16570, partial [Bryobacteraceae bacterium]|nr:hypothetical protein [Bryobacteraceae bacterium]